MAEAKYTPRLKERYYKEIIPQMMKEFGYKNVHQVPKLQKVVLNVCVGETSKDPKILENVQAELGQITGQKAVITKAKKAIAGFKIRQGLAIGCKVTLRRAIMYEFLDRLLNIALPRIRDFKGLNENSFDEKGNYSFGIKEQGIFPEIDMDKVQRVHGMDITIATSGGSAEESRRFLGLLGVPFRR